MKKIMIIDDELDILDVLERFLSKQKEYEISTYSNPIDAFNDAKNKKYDLILSDIMMPQVSGIDILKELKKLNENTKIILMTAYSTSRKKETAEQLKVDAYIEKPFQDLKSVQNAISSLI
jgi:CheY-like chemotaxis protein